MWRVKMTEMVVSMLRNLHPNFGKGFPRVFGGFPNAGKLFIGLFGAFKFFGCYWNAFCRSDSLLFGLFYKDATLLYYHCSFTPIQQDFSQQHCMVFGFGGVRGLLVKKTQQRRVGRGFRLAATPTRAENLLF
jgi:hypothetical protein